MTVSETKRREQRVNSSQVVIPCSSCQAKVGEPCSRPGQNGSCLARVSQVFREIDRTVEYPTCRSQPGDSCAVPGQGHPLRYGVAYAARDRSKDIPHLLTPGGYQVHEYHLLLDEIRSSDRMRVVSFDVRCGGKSYSVDRFAASYDGGPWFMSPLKKLAIKATRVYKPTVLESLVAIYEPSIFAVTYAVQSLLPYRQNMHLYKPIQPAVDQT